MRVLAISADRGIAVDGTKGAAVHLRSILGAMQGIGHDLILATARKPAVDFSLPFSVAELQEVESIAATFKPDVIYERYSLGHRDGLNLAKLRGIPFVLEVNAPLVQEASHHRPDTVTEESREIEVELWQEADLVLPVSSALRDHIGRHRPEDRRMEVIANGVDPELFQGLVPGLRDEPLRIGFLGHPKPWHGLARMVEIMAQLRQDFDNLLLRVVGGGPGALAIREIFGAHGLDSAIEITGPLPQAEAIARLAACDLAVAPYEQAEDFYFCPLKVLESMGAGLALVTNPLGDISQLVANHAVLIEPSNTEALVAGIAGLLNDDDRRSALGESARMHVLENHGWLSRAEELTRAIRGVMKTRQTS